MKYSLVRADYDYDTNDINIHCRDENYNKVTKKVHGFEPYGYSSVKNKEEILSHPGVYSVRETKIPFIESYEQQVIFKTESPKYVGDIRKNSSFDVHEADIPFARRFMIDTSLYSGFICDENKDIVRPGDISPVQFIQNPRICYFDIETDIISDTITITSFYDSQTKKYISISINEKSKPKKTVKGNHVSFIVPDEKSLIITIKKMLRKINPDVLTAWWIDFDIEYLNKKSVEHTGKPIDLSGTNFFDLLEPYKKIYNKGSNKLKDVIVGESLDIPTYEPYQQKFWKNDLQKGITVNKSHTEAIVKLDEKLEIIETYWNYKSIAGFEDLNPTLYHGSMIDIIILRAYHGKYILPSKPDNEKRQKRRAQKKVEKVGGKVFDPPYGLFKNVPFFDMSRYYPELIIGLNLTYEKVKKGEVGIMPKATLGMIEDRLKYDDRLNKLEPGTPEHKQLKMVRDSIKAVLNSIFGYTGYEGARLFRLDIFNKITKTGQAGLIFCRDRAKEDNKDLIYGDTDSIALQIQTNEECKPLIKDKSLIKKLLNDGMDEKMVYMVAHAIEYTNTLNHYLKDFCSQKGFKRNLELKIDRIFENILFKKIRRRIDGKWVERGAKKRYCGNVLFEGKPTNYLKIVGFEYVRKDAAPITKDIQPNVFEHILSGDMEKTKDYIRDKVNEIENLHKEGKLYPSEIAIPTTLSKPPNKYGGLNKNGDKLTPPEYARGAIFANEFLGENIGASDQIHMLYVKKLPGYPQTDVISYTDPKNLPKDLEIDIDKHIDRTIKKPLEKVIDSVDITWKDIFAPNNTLW